MFQSLDKKQIRPVKSALTRRGVLMAGTSAAAILAAPTILRAQQRVLYINSQGGSWEAAARKHLIEPFTEKTGIEVKLAPGASFAKLALQARTGVYEFDIQTVGAPSVVQAMNENLIEPINFKIFDRSAVPDHIVFENGVGNHAYSTNICYNTKKYEKGSVKTWKDFWNVEKFPGNRALGRTLSQTIVFALLADGAPRDKLYPIDLDRVFKSLDKIKQQTRVWWTTGPQSKQLLGDGEIDMSSVWHAHGTSLRDSGAPIDIVWNEFTMDRTYWIVSKGTPRADAAWQFINFALQPKASAGFCTDGFYGPLNPAAFQYIAEKDALNMPTNPKYAAEAIEYDGRQMGEVMTPVLRRFERWLQS